MVVSSINVGDHRNIIIHQHHHNEAEVGSMIKKMIQEGPGPGPL
jgi:hypothetical protein